MFLAHAAKLKVRVHQLDFVGAFLQAKMQTRMFVAIPQIYGVLFLSLQNTVATLSDCSCPCMGQLYVGSTGIWIYWIS
jgi:hypothetical protein